MYYINAKQQKKKEEIHFFYAFPQIFYKNFTFSCLDIVHKSILEAHIRRFTLLSAAFLLSAGTSFLGRNVVFGQEAFVPPGFSQT